MLDVTAFRVLLLLLGCALLGAAWWSLRATAAQRRRPGARDPICARCLYQLQGLAQPCCSECGADLQHEGVIETWQHGQTLRMLRTWLLAAPGGAFVVLSILAAVRIGAVPAEVTHLQVFAGPPSAAAVFQQPGPLRTIHSIGVRAPFRAGGDSAPGSGARGAQVGEAGQSGAMPALPVPEWTPPRIAADVQADVLVSLTPPTAQVELSEPFHADGAAALLQTLREVFALAAAPRPQTPGDVSGGAPRPPVIVKSQAGMVAALAQLPPDGIEWSRQEVDDALLVLDAALSEVLEPRFQRAPSAMSRDYPSGWWSSVAIYSTGGRAGTPLHRPWMAWALLIITVTGPIVIVLARRRAARGRSASEFGLTGSEGSGLPLRR